jgi:hypothetical protein
MVHGHGRAGSSGRVKGTRRPEGRVRRLQLHWEWAILILILDDFSKIFAVARLRTKTFKAFRAWIGFGGVFPDLHSERGV